MKDQYIVVLKQTGIQENVNNKVEIQRGNFLNI